MWRYYYISSLVPPAKYIKSLFYSSTESEGEILQGKPVDGLAVWADIICCLGKEQAIISERLEADRQVKFSNPPVFVLAGVRGAAIEFLCDKPGIPEQNQPK